MPRIKQSISTPAAEASRARTQLLAGMRTPEWSTVVGKLHTMNKLTLSQYNTAKKWHQLVNDYAAACQAPKPPTSAQLDRDHGGRPADIESVNGQREASRHRRITEIYDDALATLRRYPGLVRILDNIVVHDRVPSSLFDLSNLKFGLERLADHWAEQRRAR